GRGVGFRAGVERGGARRRLPGRGRGAFPRPGARRWDGCPPGGRKPTLSRAEKFVYFDRHGRLRCTGWGRGQVGTGPSDRGEGPEALLRDPIGVQPGGRSADAGTHGSTRRSATNEARERDAGQDPRGEKAMADSNWEDALIHLHEMGWDTDDIDSACEALVEACREGIFEGNEPSDLDSAQLKQILGGDMSSSEQEAVVCLAEVRAQEDPEAEAMREALWDIDEFAESR